MAYNPAGTLKKRYGNYHADRPGGGPAYGGGGGNGGYYDAYHGYGDKKHPGLKNQPGAQTGLENYAIEQLPEEAWHRAMSQSGLPAGAATPFADFIGSEYDRAYADFGAASLDNPFLKWDQFMRGIATAGTPAPVAPEGTKNPEKWLKKNPFGTPEAPSPYAPVVPEGTKNPKKYMKKAVRNDPWMSGGLGGAMKQQMTDKFLAQAPAARGVDQAAYGSGPARWSAFG